MDKVSVYLYLFLVLLIILTLLTSSKGNEAFAWYKLVTRLFDRSAFDADLVESMNEVLL